MERDPSPHKSLPPGREWRGQKKALFFQLRDRGRWAQGGGAVPGGLGEMREGIPGNMRKGSEVGCGKDAGTLAREGTGSVGGVRGEQAR